MDAKSFQNLLLLVFDFLVDAQSICNISELAAQLDVGNMILARMEARLGVQKC